MPEKDPQNWTMLTYAMIVFWAIIGGVVSFWAKVRQGVARWLNLHELIGELVTSGFIGLTVGLALEWAGAPLPLAFAIVGVAGHMGSRGIFYVENLSKAAAEKHLGVKIDSENP
jgi:uncharacterized membrane protein